MPLIYPVSEDTPDDAESNFDDFSSDWSHTWVIEIDTEPEHEEMGDFVRLGPLEARAAWDFGHELEEKRPAWMVSIMPLFPVRAGDVDDLISQVESDDD